MNAEKNKQNENVTKEQSDPVLILHDVVFDLHNAQSIMAVLEAATSRSEVDPLLDDVAGVIRIVFVKILDSANNLEKVIDTLTK